MSERLARLFHETYERLAPDHGYETRKASAKPWEEVPERNRALMIATCAEVEKQIAQERDTARAEVEELRWSLATSRIREFLLAGGYVHEQLLALDVARDGDGWSFSLHREDTTSYLHERDEDWSVEWYGSRVPAAAEPAEVEKLRAGLDLHRRALERVVERGRWRGEAPGPDVPDDERLWHHIAYAGVSRCKTDASLVRGDFSENPGREWWCYDPPTTTEEALDAVRGEVAGV